MNDNKLIKYTRDGDFINYLRMNKHRINGSNKTVLFIEPYGATLSLLRHGLSQGFNIIVLTANSDLRVVPNAILSSVQIAIAIDTASDTEILHLMDEMRHEIHLDAVIPGFEYFVSIAAKVSCKLGLPGIDVEHVINLRRKDQMRHVLMESGICVPRYSIVRSFDDLKIAIQEIGFPAVCKPIDAAGSVNVRKVNNECEAFAAATRILNANDVLWGYRLSTTMLYEEYITGKEFSLEGVVHHDVIKHFSITEKFVSDEIDFVEIGHIANAQIDESTKKIAEDYVDNVIRVLHANHSAFHAEIRIKPDGEPVLMEIAARLAGDRIGDLISLAKNINYYDHVYAAYFGEYKARCVEENHYAGIRFFYRPEIEKYLTVHGLDEAQKYPIEELKLYYEPNNPIPAFQPKLSNK